MSKANTRMLRLAEYKLLAVPRRRFGSKLAPLTHVADKRSPVDRNGSPSLVPSRWETLSLLRDHEPAHKLDNKWVGPLCGSCQPLHNNTYPFICCVLWRLVRTIPSSVYLSEFTVTTWQPYHMATSSEGLARRHSWSYREGCINRSGTYHLSGPFGMDRSDEHWSTTSLVRVREHASRWPVSSWYVTVTVGISGAHSIKISICSSRSRKWNTDTLRMCLLYSALSCFGWIS